MNLSDDLRRQLVQSVFNFINDPPPTGLVATLIGHEALAGAPAGMNGFRYAEWIVHYSLRQSTKDVFVGVVRQADAGKALSDLQALVTELEADSSKWSAPAEALWIPTGWPFVDRQTLRETLVAMTGGGGPPALSIEGPFGNGKRTIGAYIRHLADQTDAFDPVIRELQPEPVPGALFDTVTELSMRLGQEPDLSTTHAEPERQGTTLARQVALAAPAAPIPIWFVANVVNHVGLEEGVLAFVDELLRLVQSTPSIAEKLRVLVLCDQLSLLELENAPPLPARHTLPQITDVEIRQWLEAAVPGKEPALYELAAESVVRSLATAPPAGASRTLRWLSLKCRVAHGQLAGA